VSVKNGLSAITNEVLTDVQKEAEAIILAAEKEAKQTIKIAKEQADKNYSSIIDQASAKSEAEKRKIASITEVEIRNQLLRTKEELVDAAFERASAKIKDFVKTEDYHRYMLKLIESIAKNMDQKDLEIIVNHEDRAWLTQDILNSLSKKVRGELKLSNRNEDYVGGFKIQTLDGKITYDSTLDNRLKELKPTLRVEVAKAMFEKVV
jgi:V/A-type H+-transporting ATPase subunit E